MRRAGGRRGRRGQQFQGLTRALLASMVRARRRASRISLDLIGVGYRAEVKGQQLNLALGLSHPVEHPAADGVSARVEIIDEAGIKKPRLHLSSARQDDARPDRSAHPFVPAAGALQGQGRALHRREAP